jgi:hypothetical protein
MVRVSNWHDCILSEKYMKLVYVIVQELNVQELNVRMSTWIRIRLFSIRIRLFSISQK